MTGAKKMKAGDLARRCPLVQVTDSLGKAAEAMRQSGCPLLPVLDGNQIVGVVDEDTLLAVSLDSHGAVRVGEVMEPTPIVVPSDASLLRAAWLMQSRSISALPVIDGDGTLKGVLTKSDVASALLRGLRPARIGGMATPFGVYLTTGTHRGGVRDLALVATGVMMALCLILARFLALTLLFIADEFFQTNLLTAYLLESYGGVSRAPWGGTWLDIVPWLEILLFFTVMRLLPLAGYHGAEHQVVHAIERGEDLTFEAASKMPLEHPRCGTNLAMLVILLGTIVMSNIPPFMMIGLLTVVLLFWRQAGMLLQRSFTVKRPKQRQLLSGLKAGEELLQRFYHQPFRPLPIPVQIWYMGFLQVFVGAGVSLLLANQILLMLGFPRLLFAM